MKHIIAIALLATGTILLSACGHRDPEQAEPVPTYASISQEEAKALMDSETGFLLLDVRTQSEYEEGHIPGALLIPDYSVAELASEMLPDREQLILVYCRTGRRSKNAAATLAELGYTNVREFGGIVTWPYEIE